MIDRILEKHNILPDKYYRITMLYDIFFETGIIGMKRSSFTSDWVIRKINKGELVLPEKGKSKYYFITGKQIGDIVRAFLPGGKGEYNYQGKEGI